MCPASADADVTQMWELAQQGKAAGATAFADGDLTRREWRRARRQIVGARIWLWLWKLLSPHDDATFALERAERHFGRACDVLDD